MGNQIEDFGSTTIIIEKAPFKYGDIIEAGGEKYIVIEVKRRVDGHKIEPDSFKNRESLTKKYDEASSTILIEKNGWYLEVMDEEKYNKN